MSSIKIPKCPFPNPYKHNIVWNPLWGFKDMDIVGHYIVNKDKTMFKIMLWEHFNCSYFRGQNKDFPSFLTSLQRLKTPLDRCLAYVQKEEFIDWFLRTPYYQYFAYNVELPHDKNTPIGQGMKFCFDLEAIAQHYEFATNYLDITTKKDIALFFAYTYKDQKTDEYKPIEDFNAFQPHLFEVSYNSCLKEPFNPDVRIIGFQPLRRPILQYAMGICMDSPKTDYNCEFIKCALPTEKQKAYEIYDKFEGGKNLFPNDFASLIAKKIKDRVVKEKIINFDIFLKYCKLNQQDTKEMENILHNNGYNFSNEKLLITKDDEIFMQKEIDEVFIPWVDEFVR